MAQYDIPDNIDLNNPEFKQLQKLIEESNRSVFLTGRAGTGKSTFLRYICATTKKQFVVLAPTGIAAINVGGMTLHSFFKIPLKPIVPDDPDFAPSRLKKTLKYNNEKRKLLASLQLIIIDEISMVRADIIDFIDRVLREYGGNRREPFGGKQILFVGDVFQLEPVVKADEREVLQRYYPQGQFFFNARAFREMELVAIELLKNYRQANVEFSNILDRIREDKATDADLRLINTRFMPDYEPEAEQRLVMTLAFRRDTVDAINERRINELDTEMQVFEGKINEEFPTNILPTERLLQLKVGAQVMFIRNDREQRWCNGTLGRVVAFEEGGIKVETDTGLTVLVEQCQWENIRYSYDEKKKKVNEELLGTFTQFPLKLAWAITVHKSQGLTFNDVIIDFSGGAFTGGQAYVALSRCTSLEGITLLRQMSWRDIIVNQQVILFSRTFNDRQRFEKALNEQRAKKLFADAAQAYDHGEYRTAVECFAEGLTFVDVLKQPAVRRLMARKLQARDAEVNSLKDTIFHQQATLRHLASEYVDMGKMSAFDTDDLIDYAGEDTTPYGDPMNSPAVSAAMSNFRKAMEISPDYIPAYEAMAKLYQSNGKDVEALELYLKALDIAPANAALMLAAARLYADHGNTDAAIKLISRAVKIERNSPKIYNAIAHLADTLGLEELAERARRRARRARKA